MNRHGGITMDFKLSDEQVEWGGVLAPYSSDTIPCWMA